MRKIAFTFLLLFISTRLWALGLDNIELNSSLNQAFDARIELLSPTPAEIDTLSVRLADLEAFDRAGIERAFILTSLRFEIEINDSGADYIRITSSEAIREPYLNFLLEASWSSGRLFREYTVLLDPPLYDPNTRRISTPATSVSEPASVTPSEDATSSSVSSSLPVSSYSEDNYGPTVSDDTLWSIASQVRPDSGISIQQMMLALLRANPEAFIENNINGLREGQIIRVPDRDEILQTSSQSALSEVQSQNSLWEELRGTFAANATQRPAGGTTQATGSSATSGIDEGGNELRLVSPSSDVDNSGQAAASFDSTGGGGAGLVLANEQLETLAAENDDLRNQLDESETLIQDLQRLLELRDDELATLQQQTAGGTVVDDTSVEASEEIVENYSDDTQLETVAEVVSEEIVSLALDDTQAPVETPAEEETSVDSETSLPPDVSTQAEISTSDTGLVGQILSFVFGNLLLVGGALGGLIIAIAALFFIKKHKEASSDDEELASAEFPDFESSAAETAMPEESEVDSEIDAIDEDNADKPAFIGDDESDQLAEEVADAVAEEPAPVVEEAQAEEPEEDPLAEVNVFLAYEHFDQAEEFVRDAIQGDPNNLDFHSKLLEIFYSSGDKAKYEEEAAAVQELTGGEGAHWEMATIMWQEISPNRELFAEPVDGEEDASEEAKGGGIVDLTADDEGGGDDDGLDFDIGGGESEQSTDASAGGDDDGMLDITSGSSDDVLDVTADASDSGDEDLLDVTAAVGLDEFEKEAESEDENVLDITGDSQPEDDVLDISASPAGDEDLLDVTSHTEIEAEGDEDLLDVTAATSGEIDMESTMKVPSESSDGNDLDFDIGGVEESSDDNVVDFDAAAGESPAEEEESLDISLDMGVEAGSDTSDDSPEISLDAGEDDGGIELDLGDDAGGDDGLEISLDAGEDDGGIELDLGDDAGGDDGLEISLDAGEDDGGIELDLGDDAGGDDGLEISLDAGEDDGGIELDMGDDSGADSGDDGLEISLDESGTEDLEVPEISLDDDDDDDDEDEDHTVFVPRTSDAGEQSAEDEIATKLDLAKAYVELGDGDSAKTILDEIIAEGNDEQKKQAEELKAQVS